MSQHGSCVSLAPPLTSFLSGASVGEDAETGKATLSPASARSLHCGQLMARILTVMKTPGVSQGLSPGTDAASVHANWEGVLLPALETSYGVFLSPKQRALLWSGDGDTLADLVEHLHSRLTGEPLDGGGGTKASILDADVVEQVTLLAAQLSSFYGSVLASLLVVFVPQMCPPNPPLYTELHECTIAENLYQGSFTAFNRVVQAINFWTLLCVLLTVSCMAWRESFIIKYTDIDPELPEGGDKLQEELASYPRIQGGLASLNRQAYIGCWAVNVSMVVNIVLSTVFIVSGPYNMGKASYLGLVSSTLLHLPKALAWYRIMAKAQSELPTTYVFGVKTKVGNAIDKSWRFRPEVFQPPSQPWTTSTSRFQQLAMQSGGEPQGYEP